MRFITKHRTVIASGAVLSVGAASLLAFALSATGYPTRHVDLNDSGIWVTNNSDGLFGRLNKSAASLDAYFNPPGGSQQNYSLDVRQDQSAVVAWDKSAGKLFPVDVNRAVALPDAGIPVPAADQVDIRGGTIAVLDPASGKIWATRYDPANGLVALAGLDPTSPPAASVATKAKAAAAAAPAVASTDPTAPAKAALAVGVDGTVFAVSAAGKIVTLTPTADGFAKPAYGQLGAGLGSVSITAVGTQMVVFDPATGTLALPGGRTVALGESDPKAQLQIPGADTTSVMVASSTSLYAVPLTGQRPAKLFAGAGGAPAAPVTLGGCSHAAWAGTPGTLVTSCAGQPAKKDNLQSAANLLQPVFRVNRNVIALNDTASGAVFDLDTRNKVDNWSAIKPPPVDNKSNKTKDLLNPQHAHDKPPKAVADMLGARPGRSTVLHVLDNDSDPAGNILLITSLTDLDNPAVQLAIAPDAQTVMITLPAQTQDVHFKYTIDNGKGLSGSATVTVQARGPQDNKPPNLRAGVQPKTWSVATGANLSVPVLGDWRDFDGDNVVMLDALATAGVVAVTPDGRLDYTAPATAGAAKITYHVSDGVGVPVDETVDIQVQNASDAKASAATAEPDVARGQVAQPITIRPLINDLPGTDPATPTAVLALAGNVASPQGTTVVTDLQTGTLTVSASRAGTYFLPYSAAFGSAPFANGTIRVDVASPPSAPLPPVTMPDAAVVRGQAPATVDVLANDFDPSGAVLVVQHADPVDGAQLQVAIVRGHWLRITALTPTLNPNPQLVRYSVTDGITAPVTGEVSVTQLPTISPGTPIAHDDYAVVRAADTTTVAVLDNDFSPNGSPLSLVPDVPGAPHPGQLAVNSPTPGADLGTAYVAGSFVRYVAPATVTTPLTVQIEYVAQDPAGNQSVGHAHITITPAPNPPSADQAPLPQPIEARIVAGDTATIAIPSSGTDPDGDSVTVVGIASPAQLGRVVAIGATSLTYQAYPTSSGTETFSYVVTDRYAKTGTSTIRVAVVPPGDPQAPVAVDDVITAAPNTHLSVNVLANDVISAGDPVTIQLTAKTSGVSLTSPTGPIQVTAPGLTGKPLVVPYTVTDGLGSPSTATLTVRAQENYNVPPVALDAFAKPAAGATSVSVDVLTHDFDPDGDPAALSISRVFDAKAQINRAKLTLPVLDHPQTIAYEIKDAGGATAVASVFVPAVGAGAPYAKADQTIALPKNASATVDIASYVTDPASKPLRLTTTDRIWASPANAVQVATSSIKQLTLTSRGDYVGPASVTFEVTNGLTLTDGQSAVVTVPAQVGPPTPVLRCPTNPLTLVEGGHNLTIDVTSLCHVWTPRPGDLAGLQYTATWKQPIADVNLTGSGSRKVDLAASGAAKPGATGTISIAVAGTDAVAAQLNVRVEAAPPPTATPITVDGVKAGSNATVNVAQYVSSRLRDPAITVISVQQISGLAATTTVNGTTLTLTPGPAAKGTMTFTVVLSDVADKTRHDRTATTLITLHVLGVPDAPGVPQPGRTVLSGAVQLSWTPPANNGAPIDSYEVNFGSGKQTCPASPCTITGLHNGTAYTFTVRAHNLVNWGNPSPQSSAVTPNQVPDAVTGLTTSNPQDHGLVLTWAPAHVAGTPVQDYQVSWNGGGASTVTGTTTTATGLTNDNMYTFTVVARNAMGPGQPATTTGQSAGAPTAVPAPTFTATDSANASSRAVRVSWPGVDPNGPAPTTYTLTRTGGAAGQKAVCTTTTTTCADDGLSNDGTIYSYSVTAANAAPGPGHTSPAGATAQMEATATPGPISNFTATPTGTDGQATLRFDAPPSHGATSTITCTNGGTSCGTWTYPTSGQAGATQTIAGLPNGQTSTISLQDCNGSHGGTAAGSPCDTAVSAPVTTYGPIRNLAISPSASGPTVNFTISVDPNGKPATVHVQTNLQNQTFTTGVGAWSWASSDNVGYNTTDTITVTVSDSGRATVSGSKSVGTPAPPPPPPPPPSVTASKGAACATTTQCGTAPGTVFACNNCSYIHVQTANFPGSVTCTFNSSGGSGGFVNQTFAANANKDSWNFFGFSTRWVQVTCGGVASNQYTWP